jgi:hypothetical protein
MMDVSKAADSVGSILASCSMLSGSERCIEACCAAGGLTCGRFCAGGGGCGMCLVARGSRLLLGGGPETGAVSTFASAGERPRLPGTDDGV